MILPPRHRSICHHIRPLTEVHHHHKSMLVAWRLLPDDSKHLRHQVPDTQHDTPSVRYKISLPYDEEPSSYYHILSPSSQRTPKPGRQPANTAKCDPFELRCCCDCLQVGRDYPPPVDLDLDLGNLDENAYRLIKYEFSEDVLRLPSIQVRTLILTCSACECVSARVVCVARDVGPHRMSWKLQHAHSNLDSSPIFDGLRD